jgi:hypothetical protein
MPHVMNMNRTASTATLGLLLVALTGLAAVPAANADTSLMAVVTCIENDTGKSHAGFATMTHYLDRGSTVIFEPTTLLGYAYTAVVHDCGVGPNGAQYACVVKIAENTQVQIFETGNGVALYKGAATFIGGASCGPGGFSFGGNLLTTNGLWYLSIHGSKVGAIN